MNNNKNKDSFLKEPYTWASRCNRKNNGWDFLGIPLGNMIGSEGMGYYQAAYPVYTLFLTLATAGFPTAVAKLVSEKLQLEILKVQIRYLRYHIQFYSLPV